MKLQGVIEYLNELGVKLPDHSSTQISAQTTMPVEMSPPKLES
jgi:hypothetical protein